MFLTILFRGTLVHRNGPVQMRVDKSSYGYKCILCLCLVGEISNILHKYFTQIYVVSKFNACTNPYKSNSDIHTFLSLNFTTVSALSPIFSICVFCMYCKTVYKKNTYAAFGKRMGMH